MKPFDLLIALIIITICGLGLGLIMYLWLYLTDPYNPDDFRIVKKPDPPLCYCRHCQCRHRSDNMDWDIHDGYRCTVCCGQVTR